MRRLVLGLGLILLILRIGDTYEETHYVNRWALTLGGASLSLAWFFAKRTSLFLLPILAMAYMSSAWGFVRSPQFFYTFHLELTHAAAYSWMLLTSFCLWLAFVPPSWKSDTFRCLAFLPLLAAAWTLVAELTHPGQGFLYHGAFIEAVGMNGVFIACLAPFWIERLRGRIWLLSAAWVLTLTALQIIQVRTPWGALGVALAALFISKMQSFRKTWAIAVIMALAFMGYGFIFRGGHYFDTSGRILHWMTAFRWWWHHTNHFIGAGLGTSLELLPALHNEAGVYLDGPINVLHNDWLQVLFDMGYLGLAAALLAWGYLSKRAYKNPALFGSFMALSFSGLFYYPCHLPIPAVSLVFIIGLILQEPTYENESLHRLWQATSASLKRKLSSRNVGV